MPRRKRTKKTAGSFYGRKETRGKHNHKLDLGKGRKGNSYDKLYREQLSVLSALFHKKG